jgi:hypothetical protein
LQDYEVKVMLDRSVYLVDVAREKIGRVLKLDSIEGSKLWNGIDMLIFNTWHWWNRRGPTQPYCPKLALPFSFRMAAELSSSFFRKNKLEDELSIVILQMGLHSGRERD